MEKLQQWIRLFFEGIVYYQVADLHLMFEVSKGKIKKELELQEAETKVIKGFGRKKWISEIELNKLVIDGLIADSGTTVKCKELEMRNSLDLTSFFNQLSQQPEEVANNMMLNSLRRVNKGFEGETFTEEEDRWFPELVEANKELIKQNLAFRFVRIDLKNCTTDIAGYRDGRADKKDLNVLVDKDMNILDAKMGYINKGFEVFEDRLLFDCNENWYSENPLNWYDKNTSIKYGNVVIDENKIIESILKEINKEDFTLENTGCDVEFTTEVLQIPAECQLLLKHKDTLITRITTGVESDVVANASEEVSIDVKFEEIIEEQNIEIEFEEEVITPDEILDCMPRSKEINSMEDMMKSMDESIKRSKELLEKCDPFPFGGDSYEPFGVMIKDEPIKRKRKKKEIDNGNVPDYSTIQNREVDVIKSKQIVEEPKSIEEVRELPKMINLDSIF